MICERFADREALVFAEERYSFLEVKQRIDEASRYLLDIGLKPGDRLALWLPNRAEFLWYWMGAAQIGVIVVVLNTRLKLPEVTYQLEQSESCALVLPGRPAFRDFLAEIATLCPELRAQGPILSCAALPHLRRVIVCEQPDEAMPGVTLGARFDAPAPAPGAPLPLATDPDAPALISYSSGTTALPKGALITHCVWRKGYDIGARADLTEQDRLYLCIPLFGSMAMMNAVLPLWTRGGAIVLAERFEADAFLSTVAAERCTCSHFLPPMVEALLAHTGRHDFDLSSLRIGWVLSNDRAVLEAVATALGVPGMLTGYGLTETTTVLTRNRWDDPLEIRLTTQGFALPDVELRIADPETGAAQPPGTPGEIWARGYCITPGYFKKPVETAKAITPEGWFRTGDLGVVDESGRLTYLSRLGDGYKSRGFNVSPAEVEAVLNAHQDVATSAVVGIPHEKWGAVGAAFVVPEAGARPAPEALIDYLRPRLSSFKLPEMVVLVEELPMTAGTGKVQKFKLREHAMALDAGSRPSMSEAANPLQNAK
ncbi:AMP-binding protein [Xanthobacter sp. DSM 24535]|uniref:class I adenylate-forming enzyme family protein n=1 Tax=Roseixanthobacter psychrophilus TaxID=3119917 RepID=UPI00372BF371